METFCWDFVPLSRASPPTDAASSVCKSQSISIYCRAMLPLYAPWDLAHFVLSPIIESAFKQHPGSKSLLPKSSIIFTQEALDVKSHCVSCFVLWTLCLEKCLPLKNFLQGLRGALAGWRHQFCEYHCKEGTFEAKNHWMKMLKQ